MKKSVSLINILGLISLLVVGIILHNEEKG